MEKFYSKCRICEKEYTFEANTNDLLDWQRGHKHIQDALPYLNANTRELLISGTCGKCFDEMFGTDDE
jgi:hypothetical protein